MDSSLKLLGLIYRAKKLLIGQEVLDNLRNCRLLIIAKDTSDKNKERYLKKCEYYKLTHVDDYSSEQLSKCLGKNNVKLIGIIDEGFAKTLLEKMKEDINNG
ncbi:MAG: 50S ribosomal protein L7ae [Erysipelotrichaceae bacterium]|nr:50S ribosomal protein L7ae [Erysipelotrichaceae bacterium]